MSVFGSFKNLDNIEYFPRQLSPDGEIVHKNNNKILIIASITKIELPK